MITKRHEDLLAQIRQDDQSIINEMIRDGMLPPVGDGSGLSMEESDAFFDNLSRAKIAKATAFARQDVGTVLMTAGHIREDISDVKHMVLSIHKFLIAILIVLAYVAYKV